MKNPSCLCQDCPGATQHNALLEKMETLCGYPTSCHPLHLDSCCMCKPATRPNIWDSAKTNLPRSTRISAADCLARMLSMLVTSKLQALWPWAPHCKRYTCQAGTWPNQFRHQVSLLLARQPPANKPEEQLLSQVDVSGFSR